MPDWAPSSEVLVSEHWRPTIVLHCNKQYFWRLPSQSRFFDLDPHDLYYFATKIIEAPISPFRGRHDMPRLVCKFIPCKATMIDTVPIGFEETG